MARAPRSDSDGNDINNTDKDDKNNHENDDKNDADPVGDTSNKNDDFNGGTSNPINNAAVIAVAGDPRHPLDDGGCFICKKNDKQDLILLCDGCDGEYHTFCVKPPLRKIPDDEWFCNECKAAGKGGPKPEPVSM